MAANGDHVTHYYFHNSQESLHLPELFHNVWKETGVFGWLGKEYDEEFRLDCSAFHNDANKNHNNPEKLAESTVTFVRKLFLAFHLTDGLAFDLLKAWQQYEDLIYLTRSTYRDHFMHQFYNFLLGCLLIEGIYERFQVHLFDDIMGRFRRIYNRYPILKPILNYSILSIFYSNRQNHTALPAGEPGDVHAGNMTSNDTGEAHLNKAAMLKDIIEALRNRLNTTGSSRHTAATEEEQEADSEPARKRKLAAWARELFSDGDAKKSFLSFVVAGLDEVSLKTIVDQLKYLHFSDEELETLTDVIQEQFRAEISEGETPVARGPAGPNMLHNRLKELATQLPEIKSTPLYDHMLDPTGHEPRSLRYNIDSNEYAELLWLYDVGLQLTRPEDFRFRFLRQWFLASMFHDIGYPAETLSDLKQSLHEKFFNKIPNFGLTGPDLHFYDEEEDNIKDLLRYIACIHLYSEFIDVENTVISSNNKRHPLHPAFSELVKLFSDEAFQTHDHGVTGAIFFLKTALIDMRETVSSPLETRSAKKEGIQHVLYDLYVAASAIAGHNMRGRTYPKYNVDFFSRPIGALLNFCDDLQEWDRNPQDYAWRNRGTGLEKIEIVKKPKRAFCENCPVDAQAKDDGKDKDADEEYLYILNIKLKMRSEASMDRVQSRLIKAFLDSVQSLFESSLSDKKNVFFDEIIIRGLVCERKLVIRRRPDGRYQIGVAQDVDGDLHEHCGQKYPYCVECRKLKIG